MSKLRTLGKFILWESRRSDVLRVATVLAVVFWSLLLFAYFSYAG